MKVSIVAEKFTKMLEMRETKIDQIIILDVPLFYIIESIPVSQNMSNIEAVNLKSSIF